MNTENKTSENVTISQVVVEIVPPQLIKYLNALDNSLEEERKREIHEQFRNVRCFQHVLGTTISFKLVYDKPVFSKAKIIIEPQNGRSVPIKLWQCSVPKTLAMSLRSETEPAFLTYVSNLNEVTVFSPEMQEPIGRIVRRENSTGADIFCMATSKSFTMTIVQSHMPALMRITDSQGRLVGTAGVTNWKTISKYSTTTYLKQFELKLENGLSEPTRVMMLVAFANWAMWTNENVTSDNTMKKIIGFGISGFIFLALVFFHAFRHY